MTSIYDSSLADIETCNGTISILLKLIVERWPRVTVKEVEKILKSGADPNSRNKDGETPLMWAVTRGAYEICEVLIKYGADPNAVDNSGKSVLDWGYLFEHNGAYTKRGAAMASLMKKLGAIPRPHKPCTCEYCVAIPGWRDNL